MWRASECVFIHLGCKVLRVASGCVVFDSTRPLASLMTKPMEGVFKQSLSFSQADLFRYHATKHGASILV
jgi:hypothetical protein